jgi:hypothetical protein
LISVLSMTAVAGWVCDGVRESAGGQPTPGGTNTTVRVQDVGGTSVVYVVTETGHTNLVGRFRSE